MSGSHARGSELPTVCSNGKQSGWLSVVGWQGRQEGRRTEPGPAARLMWMSRLSCGLAAYLSPREDKTVRDGRGGCWKADKGEFCLHSNLGKGRKISNPSGMGVAVKRRVHGRSFLHLRKQELSSKDSICLSFFLDFFQNIHTPRTF